MKIFLVSNMYPSRHYESRGVFVKNFETSMSELGVDFSSKAILILERSGLAHKIVKYIEFCVRLYRELLLGDHELIYIHYPTYSALPLLPIRWAVRKPLVLNVHGTDLLPAHRRSKFFFWLVKGIFLDADLLVCPSEYFRTIAIRKLNIDDKKVIVSPSAGVDTDLFAPASTHRKHHGETDAKFTVGFISRIEEDKGWRILIQALIALQEDLPKLRVGAVFIGDGSEYELLSAEVERVGNSAWKCIRRLPQAELPQWYRSFSVFAFPTFREAESLGLVGLEAMACGIPVVASNIGGPGEYIDDGVNGYKFALGDVKDLSRKLKLVAMLPEAEEKKICAAARETAKMFDSDLVAMNLHSRLSELVEFRAFP